MGDAGPPLSRVDAFRGDFAHLKSSPFATLVTPGLARRYDPANTLGPTHRG